MKPLHCAFALLLALAAPAFAEDDAAPATAPTAASAEGVAGATEDQAAAVAEFEASLQFKTGMVSLPGGSA